MADPIQNRPIPIRSGRFCLPARFAL
ncbi:hypothetical protein Taro_028256 [Colocasia esculenta]|uniref:Uncharacterized protein n=1 Tax=Colocasia esculenta TaxID=4460 RepID=A0A843VTP2_COLES|nr:hypothetical protein [Colocasia esculenta]